MNRALLLVAALAACTPSNEKGPLIVEDVPYPVGHPAVGGLADAGVAGPADAGTMTPAAARFHAPRRLYVAQLRRSFPVVFGTNASGQPIAFGGSAALLGEPDWLDVTEESLEPSVLYVKVLDDSVRAACTTALAADATRASAASRVIRRYVTLTDTVATNPAAVDQNLRYLVLRFHGVRLAADDTTSIAALRTLFADTAAKSTTTTAWQAVCVALGLAPEFSLY